jgi:hypothetical protein
LGCKTKAFGIYALARAVIPDSSAFQVTFSSLKNSEAFSGLIVKRYRNDEKIAEA